MFRRAWFLTLMVGCGRVGFDAIAHQSDAGAQADHQRDAAAAVPDSAVPGLIAWYRFDDPQATTATDATGHGNTLTCVGSVCPTPTPGVEGGAYSFDGVDDVWELDQAGQFTSSTAFTVGLFARIDVATGDWQCAISKLYGSTYRNSWQLCFQSDLTPTFFSCSDGGDEDLTVGTAATTLGTWHHYVLRWDGATKALYVDGVLELASPHAISFDGGAITIGDDIDGGAPDHWLRGAVDEVRIYDRALQDAEIAALAAH